MADEDDWDYWMNASEAELSAEEVRLNRELEENGRRLAALPIAEQVAFYRWKALTSITENRERLRRPELNTIEFVSNLWREGIRRNQVRLLKLRTWRATGVYPGEA